MHVVHLSAERVRHIPVIRWRVARNARAPLDVLAIDFAVATDVRADRATGDCAARRGDISAASAADLVTENPADHCACDRAANVRRAAPFDFLTLDPTTLFGGADNCTHCCYRHFDDPLVAAAPVLIILG